MLSSVGASSIFTLPAILVWMNINFRFRALMKITQTQTDAIETGKTFELIWILGLKHRESNCWSHSARSCRRIFQSRGKVCHLCVFFPWSERSSTWTDSTYDSAAIEPAERTSPCRPIPIHNNPHPVLVRVTVFGTWATLKQTRHRTLTTKKSLPSSSVAKLSGCFPVSSLSVQWPCISWDTVGRKKLNTRPRFVSANRVGERQYSAIDITELAFQLPSYLSTVKH
jgi:hypothetical protein